MNKIRIGAVSYLNTKPLLFGLKQSNLMSEIELIEDYPSKIANALLQNKIDIALVPVAIIPQLKEYYIIGNFCIGAVNEVASVSIFSNVELHKIEKIILDYQSKTSVALTKILCKYYWKIDVDFIEANENYIDEIKNTTAAVIIGDRAFEQRNNFSFNYDLAFAWQQFTGLPFVFATWITNKKIDEKFIEQFDKSLSVGLENLQQIANDNFIKEYDLLTYYTKNISYHFDKRKKEGLELFLKYLNEI